MSLAMADSEPRDIRRTADTTGQRLYIVVTCKKTNGRAIMDHARLREGTKWLTCILMVFFLTLFVSPNLLAEEYGLGDIPLPEEVYQKHLKVRARAETLLEAALPDAYDARDEGIVTSPKNQGSCGSCWAFATVGAMESHLKRTFDFGLSDLSEQQQVSCNSTMAGCCGGSSSAAQYWEDKGPIYESCFGYEDSGTSCPPTQSSVPCSESAGCDQLVYRVADWHTVAASDFKTSLWEDGPSYWRFDVYSDFFSFWNGGSAGEVYEQTTGDYEGGHAVLLIGWDDSKGAYLCKNSWGENGGPNGDGTFWIAYSGHANGLRFGMSNFSVTGACGDGTCDVGENPCVCPEDCEPLADNETGLCTDGIDNDCDGAADCDDPDGDCDDDIACLCGNGVCDPGEDCETCPDDCIGSSGEGGCGNGVCETDLGEDCISCPNDCAGKQTGKPSKRFCCGDDVGCDDSRCNKDEYSCDEVPVPYCCGDGVCEGAEDSYNCEIDCYCGNGDCDPGEDQCNCSEDCGAHSASEAGLCADGIDNDCDGPTDCDDSDCGSDPACTCGERGDPCSIDSDCCSNRCHREKCK